MQSIATVEDHILAAFTELVMKLNEALFKPLLVKIVGWATDGTANTDAIVLDAAAIGRTAVLFRLQAKLADTLKVTRLRKHAEPRAKAERSHTDVSGHSVKNTLQSLYVPYSGYVLDHCSAWLKRFEQDSLAAVAVAAHESSAAAGTAADEPRKKKRSKAREGTDIADAATRWAVLLQVWRALLGTLHKAFLYDHDRTCAIERPSQGHDLVR